MRMNPAVPAELDRIIRKCLEKSPSSRYQTARELLVDLKNLKRDRESGGFASARPQRRGVLVAIALGALLLAGTAIYWRRDAGGAPVRSLAVLPFENASGDAEADYLGDGIAETLTVRLSRLPGMKVISSGSVFRYKGRAVEPQEVRRDLDVDAVVRGRISQRGSNLTVTAELVDTRDQSLLWGEQFVREPDDILAVQDEIAHAIGDTLAERLALTTTAQQRAATRVRPAGPGNAEAYEQFLRGRAYLEMRDMDMPRAIERFERAIALDPTLTSAHAWLAYSFLNLGYYCAMPAEMAFTRARELADRALAISPSEAIALTVRGAVANWYEWNPEEGERLTRQAFELAQGLVECRSQLMYVLMSHGRLDEAVAFAEQGRAFDPLSRVPQIDRAEILMVAGKTAESLAAFEEIMARSPEHPLANYWAGVIHVLLGHPEEALVYAGRFASLGRHPHSVGVMAAAHAVAGRETEARALLAEIVTRSATEYVAPVLVASVHRWLGEYEQMYEWLEKAIAVRDWWLGRIHLEPWFQAVRHEPRFQSVVERVGVAPVHARR